MDSRDTIINMTSLIESHGASTKKTSDCEPKKGITIIGHISKHQKWYKKIRKALKRENDDDENDMGVCIFRVPNHVAIVKPEAYIPQLIGLGPYHHFQPELYEMEDYKLAAVRRALAWVGEDHRQLQEFDEIVEKISKLHCPSMCDAYRGLENHNHKFLAWIMAVDGLFLFDLFQTNKGEVPPPTSSRPADAQAILKDVLKLENQIPMTVLKAINSKVMEKKSRPDSVKDHPKQLVLHLRGMLVKFCNDVSPIDLDWESSLPRNLGKSLELKHLLDLLYHYITYKNEDDIDQAKLRNPNPNNNTPQPKPKPKPKPNATSDDPNGESFSKFFTKLSTDYPKVGKFVKHLEDLISSILFFIPVSSLASLKEKKVLIPSVSELHSAGVKFKPILEHGGTQKVEFDSETKTFRLPVVMLKPTTEVVLRNLVAYETMAKSKSSNFKRYTELMSAIVDTVEDVKILMEAQVLIFRKKEDDVERQSLTAENGKECLSEVEIAEMFNGMTKTMESKDRVIDEAIKKANKCYDNTRKVKAYRMMRKYVYSSWKMLTLLASLLLLLLTALQTFCDVYDCPAMFNNQGQGNMINSNWSVV